MYLNDVPDGGETHFPRLPGNVTASRDSLRAGTTLKVRPVRGRAVAFLPADLSGVVDHRLVWPFALPCLLLT